MNDETFYILISAISTMLFILSEVLAKSDCKVNCVFDFVIYGYDCSIKFDNADEIASNETQVSESAS